MKLTKAMLAARKRCDGLCQLCHKHVERLVLDHDHTSELARGFVCDECNQFVIPAGERKPWLVSDSVRQYLNKPPLEHLDLRCANKRHEFRFGNYHDTLLGHYKDAYSGRGRFASIEIRGTETHFTFKSHSGKVSKIYIITEEISEEDLMKRLIEMRRTRQIEYPSWQY